MQEFKQTRLQVHVIWWKNFGTIKFVPNDVQELLFLSKIVI